MHLKNEIESLKSAEDEMRVIIKTNIDVKNSLCKSCDRK